MTHGWGIPETADVLASLEAIAALELRAKEGVRAAQGHPARPVPARGQTLATLVEVVEREPREFCLAQLAAVARSWSSGDAPATDEAIAALRSALSLLTPSPFDDATLTGILFLLSDLRDAICEGVPPAGARLTAWGHAVRRRLRERIRALGTEYDDVLAAPGERTSPLPLGGLPSVAAWPYVTLAAAFDLAVGMTIDPGIPLALALVATVAVSMALTESRQEPIGVDLVELELKLGGALRRHGIKTPPRLGWKLAVRHSDPLDELRKEYPGAMADAGRRIVALENILNAGWPAERARLLELARGLRAEAVQEVERAQAVAGDTPANHLRLSGQLSAGIIDPAADDQRLMAELIAMVEAQSRRLPPGQRQVLQLELVGYSPPEIAEQLRVSRGAVDVRKHRAVRALRAESGENSL